MHTTNYINTFIAVAEDSPAESAVVPESKGDKKTVAQLQLEAITKAPYTLTSDDVLFGVHAERAGIPATAREAAREEFFSKGQPCFRASPLTKRYGWGLHSNAEGKVALYAVESPEYRALLADESLKQLRAMRSKKA